MSRLIDADSLKRKVQKEATESWKMKIKASVETILNQVIDWIDEAQTVEPAQQWIPVTKEEVFQAGYDGREIRFRVNGRLFAIRELAQ